MVDNKSKYIKIFATGGTFDKEFNEINGELFFKETHLYELLKLGRSQLNIKVEIHHKIGIVNHQYSHFKVSITLYECQYQSGKPIALESDEIRWITDNQKNQFAFPSATHKLFALIT